MVWVNCKSSCGPQMHWSYSVANRANFGSPRKISQKHTKTIKHERLNGEFEAVHVLVFPPGLRQTQSSTSGVQLFAPGLQPFLIMVRGLIAPERCEMLWLLICKKKTEKFYRFDFQKRASSSCLVAANANSNWHMFCFQRGRYYTTNHVHRLSIEYP